MTDTMTDRQTDWQKQLSTVTIAHVLRFITIIIIVANKASYSSHIITGHSKNYSCRYVRTNLKPVQEKYSIVRYCYLKILWRIWSYNNESSANKIQIKMVKGTQQKINIGTRWCTSEMIA